MDYIQCDCEVSGEPRKLRDVGPVDKFVEYGVNMRITTQVRACFSVNIINRHIGVFLWKGNPDVKLFMFHSSYYDQGHRSPYIQWSIWTCQVLDSVS